MDDGQHRNVFVVGPIDEAVALDDQLPDILALRLWHGSAPAGKEGQSLRALEALFDEAASGGGGMRAQAIPR